MQIGTIQNMSSRGTLGCQNHCQIICFANRDNPKYEFTWDNRDNRDNPKYEFTWHIPTAGGQKRNCESGFTWGTCPHKGTSESDLERHVTWQFVKHRAQFR